MKKAVTTLHTPWSYQELADLTNPNKQRYCDKHGYDFIPHFTNFNFDKYYIDKNNNVYDPQNIYENVPDPAIIAKYVIKDDGQYSIPSMF